MGDLTAADGTGASKPAGRDASKERQVEERVKRAGGAEARSETESSASGKLASEAADSPHAPEAASPSGTAGKPSSAIGNPGMPHYTREWHFDPYHQDLRFAVRHAPELAAGDTEWAVWEVFQQAKRGEHHAHVGTLHAPDPEVALMLAKENYARRGECVNLWVVRADRIHATDYSEADVFAHTTDKNYREPAGYQGLRRSKIHGLTGREPGTGRAQAGGEGRGHEGEVEEHEAEGKGGVGREAGPTGGID